MTIINLILEKHKMFNILCNIKKNVKNCLKKYTNFLDIKIEHLKLIEVAYIPFTVC